MNQDSKKAPVLRFKGFSDDWEQRKLGEVATFHNGDRGRNYPQESELVKIGIPFINAGDLINGKIDTNNCKKITPDKFNSLRGAKLKIGDIVYCLRGTLGKNAINLDVSIGTIASSLVLIRPVKINNHYLFQILNSDVGNKQILKFDEGAVQPNLSVKNLRKFVIPYASKLEQDKIAKLMSLISENLTLQQRKLEQIDSLKNTVVATLFENKKTWSKVNLKDISEISSGANVDSRHSKGSFKITRIETISSGVLNEEKLGYTNEKIDNKYLLKKGDILFSNINSLKHIGKTALATSCEDIYQGMNLLRIRPNIQKVDPTYLFTFLNLPETLAWSQRFANPAVNQASINKTQVSKMPIYLPSLAEQIEIKNIVTKIDSYIYNLNKNIQNLKQTKNFLLQNMFI